MALAYWDVVKRVREVRKATCDQCGKNIPLTEGGGHVGLVVTLSGSYGSIYDTGFISPRYDLCEQHASEFLNTLDEIKKKFEEE